MHVPNMNEHQNVNKEYKAPQCTM